MAKQILIDSYFGLVRTAIAEGSVLLDYYEESPEQGRTKGNIYRGVIKKIDAPIQAAFVRFGSGKDGFLPLRDASSGNKSPKVGDAVLVQVVKDEVGEKGAALTTKISMSGRYLVYIPARESEGGISSRIIDEDRAALKKVLAELTIPEGGSVILRTAAMNKRASELQADLDRLTESYCEITDKFAQGREPGLMFKEVPPALRYLREYYTADIERIWVNQEDVLNQCRQFFHLYEPESAPKVSLSHDGPSMFRKMGLEADVDRLNSRKVALPSGANIVIDQAEALVAIDVNSAKAGGRGEDGRKRGEIIDAGEAGQVDAGTGKSAKAPAKRGRSAKGRTSGSAADLEATVFAVNLEAAGEIARQLRLRDLGGIIIIDFIDMEEDKHCRQVEEAMRKALSDDKAKIKVYDISPLGIMQISRQRLRKAGPNFSRQACDPCQGRGWHPSSSAGALAALRKMEERLHGKPAGQNLSVSAPYPVANKLLNEFRDQILSMERRFGCSLRVTASPISSGEAVIAAQSGAPDEGRGRLIPTDHGGIGGDGRAAERTPERAPQSGRPSRAPARASQTGRPEARERKPGPDRDATTAESQVRRRGPKPTGVRAETQSEAMGAPEALPVAATLPPPAAIPGSRRGARNRGGAQKQAVPALPGNPSPQGSQNRMHLASEPETTSPEAKSANENSVSGAPHRRRRRSRRGRGGGGGGGKSPSPA
ncbi:MAG: ribonuclease E/G [Fibrobacteria bacterium]